MVRAAALTLLLGTLGGCGSDLPSGARVTGLRVLATRAEQPFAPPGETVLLTSLAVDPQGRPVNLAWLTCSHPSSTSVTGCLGSLDAGPVQGTGLSSFSVTVPEDALAGLAPELDSAAYVGVVLVACPGPVEPGRGPEGLPLRCLDAAGEPLALTDYDLGVKRVLVRARDRNANPVVEQVTFDGAPWDESVAPVVEACDSATTERFEECDVSAHELGVSATAASFERGVDEAGNPFEESLIVSYHATEGIFERTVREATSSATLFRARAGARGKTIRLWFVLRDDRGGVAWTARRLTVR